MIAKTDIRKVSDLPIEQVADALGLTVRKHWSLCPFHEDSKPSLYFRVSKNKYRCYVCDHFGGPIDLAMEILGLNFHDAVCWLAQTFGILINDENKRTFQNVKPREVKPVRKEDIRPSTLDISHLSQMVASPVLTAEAKTGYEFSNWNDDVKTAERTIKVTGDTTYTATFKAIESSSSEGTSSSSVESSDSESSSSTKETSSSSKNDDGKSSSSVKAKSSSSKGKIAIPVVAQLPQFSMTTVARDVQITGAKVGAPFAIFDMQGHVMTSGRVESANFSLTVSRAGTFVVRIGYETRVVNVK